jgi:hypothetical protein
MEIFTKNSAKCTIFQRNDCNNFSSLMHDSADDGEILPPMPVIDPSELIGRTFLMDKEDGQ